MFFSVIVPVFKVQAYLKACIESVLNQSFTDWELILTDDGSPDACPQICDDYAAKDSRIRVIHKENGGLVSARQAGIRLASGDYVMHLDGDDALMPQALANAYRIIEKTKAELVSFSYVRSMGGVLSNRFDEPIEEGLYDKAAMVQSMYPKLLLDASMRHMHYFLCGKAIKRELAVKAQLAVPTSVLLGEDVCCTLPCYLQAEKVYISHTAAYIYTVREDSMTTGCFAGQLTQLETVVETLRRMDCSAVTDFNEQLLRYFCFMCFAIIAAAAENGRYDELPHMKRILSRSVYGMMLIEASFADITLKSRIAVRLIQKNHIAAAFRFLSLCKSVKQMMHKKG